MDFSNSKILKNIKMSSLSLDMEVEEKNELIVVHLHNGQSITVEKKILFGSSLFCDIFQNDPSETEIQLQTVTLPIFEKIVEYLSFHLHEPPKEVERPIVSSDITQLVSKWDADFINLPDVVLFELIKCAHYLDIKNLIELGCVKIATELRGKTAEQMQERFHFSNDLTDEEKQRIQKENEWAFK